MTSAPTDIHELIATIPTWRHRIEVAPGIVTPGVEDNPTELARLQIPVALSGKRVLDIGCSDGFYSFECERRGAEVVSIDDESSLLADGHNGMTVASQLIGSNVDYHPGDVHELDPGRDGTFDVVLFINVLYHLRNPILALDRIASVTRPGGTLILKTYFCNDVHVWLRGRRLGFNIDKRPKWWFFPESQLGGDPTNWFAPNAAALEGALRATGWESFRRVGRHGDRLYYHATRSIGT